MTSNNLEAIELLKTCAERLQDQGFSSHGNTVSELNKAIELLQADEVQNTPSLRCCEIDDDKSTKETKLKGLKAYFEHNFKTNIEVDANDIVQLIDILLEEEY